MDLPFATGSVDVCYSSNVLEHVDRPRRMAAEMLRVTRPGGTVFLSYTTWLSPWGGHETAPWHYLGGRRAARRYTRRTGHPPKNEFGRTLFATSAQTMITWAGMEVTAARAEVVAIFPGYLPGVGALARPSARGSRAGRVEPRPRLEKDMTVLRKT